jgi:Acetyl-CoA dehydrogenase C-terminal like/Acyl-CoA dehydrogenase, C-terminal domain
VGDAEQKERYELLLDLLTPVAKTYPSENGIMAVSQGLQILGGYGYCQEFPLEQYYRDIRIHPIHEGTTGIQALDLLGRKVVMKNGQALRLYLEEVQGTIQEASAHDALRPYVELLKEALERLQAVTMHRVQFAVQGDVEKFLADATLYLEFFGIIAIGWQWLIQGVVAQKRLEADCSALDKQFYEGKLHTMRYFFHYEMPKTYGLAARLMESDGLTVDMSSAIFDD